MNTVTEENKAIVARFNKEFIEGGDMQAFNEIIAEDLVNQTVPPGVSKGPDGVIFFFNHFLKPAFPDLTVKIHDQLAEGDKVTTRKSFHATHKGDFLGIPASNKPVVMDVIDIIRITNGKIAEHWGVLDMQSVIMQITSN